MTTPEGCVGGGGSWGGGFFFAATVFLDSLLGFGAMVTEAGTGNARAYGCATHLALNRSPLIFGISTSAALPEAARGGLHGGGVV